MMVFGDRKTLRAWGGVAAVLVGALILAGCPTRERAGDIDAGDPVAPDASGTGNGRGTGGGGGTMPTSSNGGSAAQGGSSGGGAQSPDGGAMSEDSGSKMPPPNLQPDFESQTRAFVDGLVDRVFGQHAGSSGAG